MKGSRRGRSWLGAWSGAWLGWLALTVLVVLGSARPGEARLRPYYVLHTATEAAAVKPRILFVLDTSGSMGNQSKQGLTECAWEECENPALYGSLQESRIGAARRVIHEVVESTQNDAKFGLMTFVQNGEHKYNSTPPKCTEGGINQRFFWVTHHFYTNSPLEITRDGHVGVWRLCQGNNIRPFAYLRWDDLGVGSVITSNDETGDVPPSPLISKAQADVTNMANANRKVQWFHKFVGVRFQPNATTDPDQEIMHLSVGDYGDTDPEKLADVWGHDFYYWPYVDGFPGYANMRIEPENTGPSPNLAGIAAKQTSGQSGKLFAPFYIDLSGTAIVPDTDTPSSREQAHERVLQHTAPIIEGGVDAAGLTPWYSTIGAI
ncbi:VWA domain-containing protein, partial [Paraliomyxa miuraensis]|uniref:VWA domain-containing protein n=1 Tax=Paraliomyxa miuraensis TaxID=376150 RepID=UPI00225BA09F